MSISRILRHPFSLILLAFFLNAAPSLLLSFLPFYHRAPSSLQAILLSLATFASLVLLPMAIIAFLFREKLSVYGWRLPADPRTARRLIAATTLLLLPLVLFLSTQDIFREYYARHGMTPVAFLITGGIATLLYFLSEEFLFHGFLFFGLLPRLGSHSFWIISALFAFLHITKPPAEIALSFFTSLIFCHLSLKTKSFLPAAIVHFFIAFTLNTLTTFAPPFHF